MSAERRVVITGLGVVSPLGCAVETFWTGLLAGKSGVGPLTRFDASQYTTRIAAQVEDFDAAEHFGAKAARRMDPAAWYAVAAARSAVADAGLDLEREDRSLAGAVVATGIGGISSLEAQARVLLERGPRRVSPFLVPMIMPNAVSGEVSIDLGLEGPSFTAVSACASSNHSMGMAYNSIVRGEADVLLTGGSEASISPLAIAGFCSARALSTRNDEPERASRPFDRDRDGFVCGEGAGILVFEELGHARARGARIFAEMLGYGQSADAHHITAPHPEGKGAAAAMGAALRHAGIAPEDVAYVNAHGTSTQLNDAAESRAIRRVFGAHADSLAVSSSKSMIGHALGAAGALELVAAALSISRGAVHLTANLENPGDGCDLDYVAKESRDMPVGVALSNSFGFGGHNCSVVIRRFEE